MTSEGRRKISFSKVTRTCTFNTAGCWLLLKGKCLLYLLMNLKEECQYSQDCHVSHFLELVYSLLLSSNTYILTAQCVWRHLHAPFILLIFSTKVNRLTILHVIFLLLVFPYSHRLTISSSIPSVFLLLPSGSTFAIFSSVEAVVESVA